MMKTRIHVIIATLCAFAVNLPADCITMVSDLRYLQTGINGAYQSTVAPLDFSFDTGTHRQAQQAFGDLSGYDMSEIRGGAWNRGNGIMAGGLASMSAYFSEGSLSGAGGASSNLYIATSGIYGTSSDNAYGDASAYSHYEILFDVTETTLLNLSGSLTGDSLFSLSGINGELAGGSSDFDYTACLEAGIYRLVFQSAAVVSSSTDINVSAQSGYRFSLDYARVPEGVTTGGLLMFSLAVLVLGPISSSRLRKMMQGR
jgi:hypothetical protein